MDCMTEDETGSYQWNDIILATFFAFGHNSHWIHKFHTNIYNSIQIRCSLPKILGLWFSVFAFWFRFPKTYHMNDRSLNTGKQLHLQIEYFSLPLKSVPLESVPLKSVSLESVFYLSDLPYAWVLCSVSIAHFVDCSCTFRIWPLVDINDTNLSHF